MANIKASELIAWVKGHLGDGYVYGTVGQTCTISLLQAKQRQYGASMGEGYYQKYGDYNKGKCARWLGRWVADCSGLIKAGRRELSGVYRDVSAQGTYDQCSRRGKIDTMTMIPGCTVYMWSAERRRMGHVGVYIGGGKVIEARGVAYGVGQTDFRTRKWGYWGLLDWLDLDLPADNGSYVPSPGASTDGGDNAGQMPDDEPCDGVPSLEARGDVGYNVQLLQQWLNLRNAQPKLDQDGIFGPKTEAAVHAFQRAHRLVDNGVVMVDTWKAILLPPPAVPLELKTLRRGDSSAAVMLMQRLLYTHGITPCGVDGRFGEGTLTSVKIFQRARGLVVDGIVGPKTWGELAKPGDVVPATVRRGSSGAEVSHLQRLLIDRGYAPGAVDGQFGPKTEGAVRAFQTANGLTVDGVAGPKTWDKLTGPMC